MLRLHFCLLLLILFACQEGHIVDVAQDNNLDKIIDSEFKRLQMPGLAYAAIKNDSIVYSGAKGYANINKKQVFTTQTRMTIASTSKTIVATAILQLYEKGLLSLDDDVNKYLSFKVRNPRFPDDNITIKMLLTHTSSIYEEKYTEIVFYLYGYVDYPESIMDFERNFLAAGGKYYFEENYADYCPGTQYSYSNVGGALLACIVEYIGGIDFNTYCKKNIFQPLGMTRTTWFFSETPQEEVAIPYLDNNNTNPSNPFYSFPTYPDGHLTTTVEDLSRFLRAYIMGGTFNGYRLLKPSTIELMLQVYTQSVGVPFRGQGLIFGEFEIASRVVWGHGGSDNGISTYMFLDKERKTGFITFANRSGGFSKTIGNALLHYADNY